MILVLGYERPLVQFPGGALPYYLFPLHLMYGSFPRNDFDFFSLLKEIISYISACMHLYL